MRRAPAIARLVVACAALAALIVLGRQAGGYVLGFAAWVQGLGAWGPVVFIAGYVLATVAFVPGVVLTLAAGVIFGLAFLVGRYLARAAVERRIAANPRFAAIDRAVGAEGRKIVFLLRLSPVFPFNLLNYALGLTRVRFADYLTASVGMLPGTVLYVYSGKLLGDVTALAGGAAVEKGAGYYAVVVLGLLATVAVTVVVTRTARRALGEATGA